MLRTVRLLSVYRLLACALLLLCGRLSAQQDPRPLFVVGGDTTSVGEFLYNFKKNREYAPSGELLSLEQFRDMYLVYRLKVADAKAMGLDTLAQFQREYSEYRDHQLAPYLLDSAEREAIYRKAYDRMRTEVDVCHILFGLDKAGGADSAKVRAQKALARYRAGEDFLKLARELSDDPSARQNSGQLGYLGAFTTVTPFEDAYYRLKDGQISEPVLTRFGYHLVLRRASRESRGRMLVAHIFARVQGEGASREQALSLMDSLHTCLARGEDFAELASRFSQDRATADKGGVLPWAETGFYPEPLLQEMFKLSEDGAFTVPIFTGYGCHLFKRLAYEPVGSYEQMLPRVKESLARVGVELEGPEAVRRECVTRLGFDVDTLMLKRFQILGNRLRWKDTLDFATSAGRMRLGTIGRTASQGGVPLLGSDVVRFMRRTGIALDSIADAQLRSILAIVSAERCVEMVCSSIRREEPRLDNLLREYYDGTLLFEVSQRKHWMSPRLTEEFLKSYFKRNRSKYRFAERVSVDLYRTNDSTTMARYVAELCGVRGKDKISDRRCKAEGVSRKELHLERGNYLVSTLLLDAKGRAVLGVSSAQDRHHGEPIWRGGCLQKPLGAEGKGMYELYRYRGLKRDVKKSFEEARAEVQFDCQAVVEADWIQELRGRIPVWINEPLMRELQGDASLAQ